MDVGNYLLKYGIKPSVQRMAIMEYLLSHKTHPTAEEIFHSLSPSIPTLSKTTVYNTLKLFSEKGVALCLNIDEKNARFDGDISRHIHFICKGCGCIHDLPVKEDQQSVFITKTGSLIIDEAHIYYKGYCELCLPKSYNKNN